MDARDEEWREAVARQEVTERLARLGSWTWRPAPGGMHWSAGLYRLLGRAPERHPPGYEALVDAVHPDDKALFLLQLETALKRKTRLSLDHRIVLSDGREREVHTEAECVFRGGEEEWVATVQERPAVAAVLDALPVAILQFHGPDRARYLNAPAGRLLGWSAAEAATMDLLAALFPAAGERKRFLDHLRGALPEWRDFPTRHGSGELREFAWAFARAADGSGLAFGIDVQERRNMERRLRESEATFRSVYESNVVPFYFWRVDGRITGANDAFLGLVGYSRAELDERRLDWASLTAAEYRARTEGMLRELLAGRAVAEPFENELLRKDGTRVPVLAGGALFPDHEGGVGFAIDLRERTAAEEELRRLNATLNRTMAELRASQRREIQVEKLTALGTLAAGVAHELNNPMMAVMNYVDYAGRVAHSDEAARTLAKALGELERMRDLLQDMLAFALPSREPTTQVALPHVVDNALNLMRPEFVRRGIIVAVDLGEGLPEVPAREGQLQQVVVNLLMNARDALERAPEKRISIRGTRRGALVELEVADSGPGIPEGIRDQIFDPFFTTKPPGRGTGLGLSVSRSIMLELGGDLILQGGNEGGAVFTLSFPVAGGAERG